ncbi:hypothetical protein N9P55_01475 [bacterium]|nr:hypothetical protein [bacterium]
MECLFDGTEGDTIFFLIGDVGIDASDCAGSGNNTCCGQRDGQPGENTYVSFKKDIISNYTLLASAGGGGSGAEMICYRTLSAGDKGRNGGIGTGGNFLQSGISIINTGITKCSYGYCDGPGRVLIRW